jgi:glucokinase
MAKTIGVALSEHVRAGLIVDYKLAAPLHCFPEDPEEDGALIELPTDSLVSTLCEQVMAAAGARATLEPWGSRCQG